MVTVPRDASDILHLPNEPQFEVTSPCVYLTDPSDIILSFCSDNYSSTCKTLLDIILSFGFQVSDLFLNLLLVVVQHTSAACLMLQNSWLLWVIHLVKEWSLLSDHCNPSENPSYPLETVSRYPRSVQQNF
jgi:hypothetical protein